MFDLYFDILKITFCEIIIQLRVINCLDENIIFKVHQAGEF